jgi:hypothetical protein
MYQEKEKEEVVSETNKIDLVQFILKEMPYWVESSGILYQLKLYPNGSEDFRFGYFNEENEEMQNILYICENITSTDELMEDLKECKKWLIDNNYITQ